MPATLPRETDVDVLIIGAGPAGLMCANSLKKAGINVRVIDQRPVKVAAGQADGIQPRTIEVLQSYGLADRLLREANQMHTAAFYNPSPDGGIELTDRAPDVTAPTARFPFEVTLHQGAIEAIFVDSMGSMGLKVERPIIPTSLLISEDPALLKNPQSHPVRVVLKHLESETGDIETETVNAKYVVGADGAHSWVRKSLGIAMEGAQTEYIWGVIDFVPDTDFPDIRNRCVIHSNNGSCMVIPREGDTVRLYIQLTGADVLGADGRVDKHKMGPHKLLDVARKSFHPYIIKTPEEFEWWTIYIIGQRVASHFSVNERVFIVGDACHTHSPKAGQGMNASMNDSHNLAWKLAHVLRGWSELPLLKTYEHERRKYAQDLINFDKEFSALFSGKPRTEEYQDGVSHEQFLKAFQTFGGFTSGIGIHYSDSPLTNAKNQALASNLVIGQRMLPQIVVRAADTRPIELQDMLPADTRFKLVIYAGDTSDKAQMAKIEKLAERLERPESFMKKFSVGGKDETVFDVLLISSGTKANVRPCQFPANLRHHWSKIFVDDTDNRGTSGGKAYEISGISRTEGAIVVVRPDGYVSMVTPLDKTEEIDAYFGTFMRQV